MNRKLQLLFFMLGILIYDTSSFAQPIVLQKLSSKSILQISSEEGFYPDSGISFDFTDGIDSVYRDKVIYGWTPDGKITMYAYYKWDTILNCWKAAYRDDTEYEINGNIARKNLFSWDSTSADWYLSRKIEYLYNDSNDLIEESQYIRELNSIDWELISHQRFNYSYTAHFTEFIVTSGDNVDTTAKTELYFNEDFQLILKRISLRNKGNGEWYFSSMDSMKYDENKRMIEDSYYSWDATNQEWNGNFKTEFKDYLNENVTLLFYYSWAPSTRTWNLEAKEEVGYTETGKQNLLRGYSWKNSTFWQSNYKLLINYDSYDNYNLYSWYSFDEDLNDWYIKNRTYYYYPYSGYVGYKNIQPESFKVYPSIVHEILNIETEKNRIIMNLYDVSGNHIRSFSLAKGMNTIYLGDLQSGIYILNSNLNGNRFSVKLIKM